MARPRIHANELWFDLPRDGGVGDFLVVGEEEGFGEDDGEDVVAFEGEVDFGGVAAVGDDAEVLVVGFHEDVGGAEVDFVGAEFAFDGEEIVGEGALGGDGKAGNKSLQNVAAGLGGGVQVAEGGVEPVLAVAAFGAAILPGGVVGDGADADEEVDIAHDFGEELRGDLFQGEQTFGECVKADLVGGEVEGDATAADTGVDHFNPEFGLEVVFGEFEGGGWIAAVEGALEAIAPAAVGAQGAELMLADDVGGEAVGVGFGAALGVGE